MTSPSPASEAWSLVEKEKRRDRFIPRISIAAWAVVFLIVLLLAGVDAPEFQESTLKLSKSFAPGTAVEAKTDLSPSGFNMTNASIETSEAYDQRVIDFLRFSLSPQ